MHNVHSATSELKFGQGFVLLAEVCSLIKLFSLVLRLLTNKLECLSVARLFSLV
jgi:hypothetical protein